MPQNKKNRRRESGNAFFLILVGVVLFGALMYSFSKGARQGDSNMTARKMTVMAADMIGYGQRLERGTARVSLRGCPAAHISFENTGAPSFPANTDAPSDFTCHVFRPMGGGISPLTVDSFGLSNLTIHISGGADFAGVGTTGGSAAGHQDLAVWFGNIPVELCREINKRLDLDSIPAIASVNRSNFGPGTSAAKWGSSQITHADLNGRSAACVHQSGAAADADSLAQGYHYFQILLPR